MPANTIQEHITQWLAGDDIAYRQIFDHYYPKFLSASLQIYPSNGKIGEEIVLNVFPEHLATKSAIEQKLENFERYLFPRS